jgi:hypothetical protein
VRYILILIVAIGLQAFSLNDAVNVANSALGSQKSSNLSNGEIDSGLKEALSLGVKNAVEALGKDGGYLNDKSVKIPLPDSLQKMADMAKSVGAQKYADELIVAMNKAASKAAPKSAEIFLDSIKSMSIEDGKKILMGGDNAATQYLKKSSYDKLVKVIAPIVKESMSECQVASYLKAFNDYYKSSGVAELAKNKSVEDSKIGIKFIFNHSLISNPSSLIAFSEY